MTVHDLYATNPVKLSSNIVEYEMPMNHSRLDL